MKRLRNEQGESVKEPWWETDPGASLSQVPCEDSEDFLDLALQIPVHR
jgi:hypothetical protein